MAVVLCYIALNHGPAKFTDFTRHMLHAFLAILEGYIVNGNRIHMYQFSCQYGAPLMQNKNLVWHLNIFIYITEYFNVLNDYDGHISQVVV